MIMSAVMILAAASSASAMQQLTDTDMEQITGQSGVSIAMDDVQQFINIDTFAYIDNEGLSSSAMQFTDVPDNAPGALLIQDFQIDVLNFNAIVGTDADNEPRTLNLKSTSAGSIPLFYDYASTAPVGGGYIGPNAPLKGLQNFIPSPYLSSSTYWEDAFTFNPITIEVTDRLPALTANFNESATGMLTNSTDWTVGGVFVTLPTSEVYIQYMSFTIAYTGDVNLNEHSTPAVNNLDTFGSIEVLGHTHATLSGWLEIAPH